MLRPIRLLLALSVAAVAADRTNILVIFTDDQCYRSIGYNNEQVKTPNLDRLAARKAELSALATSTGWRYHCHHTGDSAQSALLWLHGALDGGRS